MFNSNIVVYLNNGNVRSTRCSLKVIFMYLNVMAAGFKCLTVILYVLIEVAFMLIIILCLIVI